MGTSRDIGTSTDQQGPVHTSRRHSKEHCAALAKDGASEPAAADAVQRAAATYYWPLLVATGADWKSL